MKTLVMITAVLACRNEPEKITGEEVDTAETLVDLDGDGYYSDEDCDDGSSTVYPQADELCDGLDNDCDGEVDEDVLDQFYLDSDGDVNSDSGSDSGPNPNPNSDPDPDLDSESDSDPNSDSDLDSD